MVFFHTCGVPAVMQRETEFQTLWFPWQQKPGKKTGKPGEVWFNQAYQAFGLKSSLVKSPVSLVLPDFLG